MEYITAPLNRPTQGNCASCSATSVELEAAVTRLADNPNYKYATGQSRPLGQEAFLICGECSRTHPLWHLETGARRREEAVK